MKRVFDVIVAGSALLVALPLIVAVALAVWIKLGSPVVFRQQRPGRGGRPFELLKFRTMRDALDGDGRPLSDNERMTSFGRALRGTSLDELPQLWNVLRGDMSLVGPRPLLMHYLPLYSPHEGRRHEVRPGLTGWAQVSGRNALSWDEKFAADIWYVDNHSFWLDLKIIARTVLAIFMRRGVAADGHVTMPEFRGSAGGDANGASV